MKRAIINLGLVLFTLFAAYAPNRAEEEWKRYEFLDNKLSILFPEAPYTDTINGMGQLLYINWLEPEQGLNYKYTLIYSRHLIPQELFENKDSLQIILKGLSGFIVDKINAKIVKGIEIESPEGYPGIEVTCTADVKTRIIKMRLYLVGPYFISTVVVTDALIDDNIEMRKFFNSLMLPPKIQIDSITAALKTWKRILAPDTAFSVLIPGDASFSLEKLSGETKLTKSYSLIYPTFDKSDSNKVYGLLYIKYSHEDVSNFLSLIRIDPVKSLLSRFAQNNQNVKLLDKKLFYIKGIEVYEITTKLVDNETQNFQTILKCRTYGLNTGVLMAFLYTPTEYSNNHQIDQFFNSIEFSEKKDYIYNKIKDSSTWIVFYPPDSSFTSKLPFKPINKSFLDVPSLRKMDSSETYRCDLRDDSANVESLVVIDIHNKFDLAAVKSSKTPPDIVFDILDSLEKKIGTNTYAQEEINHCNITGFEYSLQADLGIKKYAVARFFIFSDRIICQIVVHKNKFTGNENLLYFFSSLNFLKGCEANEPASLIPGEWVTCGSKRDCFTALFPATPSLDERNSGARQNFEKDRMYSQTSIYDGNVEISYTIFVSEIGKDYEQLRAKNLAKLFLEGSMKTYVESVNGKLLKKKYISKNGFNGIEFTTQKDNLELVITRYFVAEKKLIKAYVHVEEGDENHESISKFLDSVTPCKP